MADTAAREQLSGTAFTRFFLRRYLADDHEADEISASLDLHTLRFHDRTLESKYCEALNRVACRRNRLLFRVSSVIASLQFVWFILAKSYSYWAEFVVYGIALITIYSMALIPRLQGPRWSIYGAAVMFLFSITLGLVWSGKSRAVCEFGVNHPAYCKPSIGRPLETSTDHHQFITELLGVPPTRTATWWDGTIPALVFLQLIILCFVTAEFKHVFIASTSYAVVHGVLFFVAQRSRASLGAWVALTFFVLIFNTTMMAYRKETYYRRIFWYQLVLAAGTVERKKVVDHSFLRYAQILTLPSADDLHTTMAATSGALPPTKVPVVEKFWARARRSLRKLLLIHDDPETERAFGEFITVQSVGHMTLSVTLSALVLVGNVIVLELRADTHHRLGDVIMRGGVIPVLMLVYAQVRRWLCTHTSATLMAKIYTAILIVVIVWFSLTAMTLRLQDKDGWASEGTYHMLIVQTAFAAVTVYGFRLQDFVPIALAYFVSSLSLVLRFRFEENSIFMGNCAVFLVTGWFLRHYERTLFLYFTLLRRRRAKTGVKEARANTLIRVPGVARTSHMDGTVIDNENDHILNLAAFQLVPEGNSAVLGTGDTSTAHSLEHVVTRNVDRVSLSVAQAAPTNSSAIPHLPSTITEEEANVGLE